MTITTLCRGRSTLDQYTILMRADRMFAVGRYYGGLLTQTDIDNLVEGLS